MRDWTPRQAGYQLAATVFTSTRPDTPDAPGSPVHFVPTRHGTLARVLVAPDFIEIVLRRRANDGPTFQGTVRAVDGGWAGFDPNNRRVTAVHTDLIDAEAPLLRLRTRRRSASTLRWPRFAPATGGTR